MDEKDTTPDVSTDQLIPPLLVEVVLQGSATGVVRERQYVKGPVPVIVGLSVTFIPADVEADSSEIEGAG
jgi:hypothetical protein